MNYTFDERVTKILRQNGWYPGRSININVSSHFRGEKILFESRCGEIFK
ncbi:SUKH-3 domain-containing protein [Listeria monocytogenes]|nr:SUKH-3 domain-containing protein [Listeria monocytogenes]